MFSAVFSGGIQGMQAYLVRVEVDISKGLPMFELVGSLGREVREAKERVAIALKNVEYALPVSKITVNLSPAHIRKEGTGYDLAIAAGLLACMEVYKSSEEEAFLGELALNGEIRPLNGVLPIALALKEAGMKRLVVPAGNIGECTAIKGIQIAAVENLQEFLTYLKGDEEARAPFYDVVKEKAEQETEESVPDFSDVLGQESARRAAEVAAAGFHHLLFAGPPGAGKTMIAKRIPGILPPLTEAEQLEVSSIYSIAGKLEGKMLKKRPFLAPHHTLSPQALAGGGRIPGPGLLSLAHRGILFLDEMPEFATAALEVLRQPLEDKKVHIARSQGSYTYPADFMLVCALNPCPCGYFPDRNRCSCTEPEIRRYLGKISGPILDRIDIVTEVTPVRIRDLRKKGNAESTAVIRGRVMEARERQKRRFQDSPYQFNGELPGKEVEKYCVLADRQRSFIEQVFESGQMSMRSYYKVIKLSQTLADMAGSERITEEHVSEAVCFCSGKELFWG